MFTWVPAFGGIVSTKLMTDIEFVSQTYLPKYHRLLDQRRIQVDDTLGTLRISYTTPDAAFFIFVDLSRWLPNFDGEDDGDRELALLEYLIGHGVFIEPGRAMMSTLPGHFRLGYAVEESIFRLGVKRLITAIRDLEGDKITLLDSGNGKTQPSLWSCCMS